MRTEPTSAITTADPDSDNADLACPEDVAKATFMREHGTLSINSTRPGWEPAGASSAAYEESE